MMTFRIRSPLAWGFPQIVAISVACAACGGTVLDLGERSGGKDSPGNGGPLAPVIAPKAGEVARIPGSESCKFVVGGTSANDVWCSPEWGGGTDKLGHWNGREWSIVDVPGPTSNGPAGKKNTAPSGPGQLWVVTNYGLARVHADGTSEDFSAAVKGGIAVTQIRDRVFVLAADGTIYASDGGPFSLHSSLRNTVINPDRLLGASDGSLWAVGRGGVARLAGESWNVSNGLMLYSLSTLLKGGGYPVVAGGAIWNRLKDGEYCPDWCHPGIEPLHETIVGAWSEQHTAMPGGVTTEAKIEVPADIPRDGSVAYAGIGFIKTKRDRPGFVGCTSSRTGEKHVVIHEWDGTTLGPGLKLAGDISCDSFATVPLSDGNVVVSTRDQSKSGPLVVLDP